MGNYEKEADRKIQYQRKLQRIEVNGRQIPIEAATENETHSNPCQIYVIQVN